MTVASIHPEDLLDKLAQGELGPAERELLEAHLASCDVCRFELGVSVDLRDEARSLSLREPPAQLLTGGPSVRVTTAPERRRPRRMTWSLVAAVLISATGSLAAVTAPGQKLISLFQTGGSAPTTLAVPSPPPVQAKPKAARTASAAAEPLPVASVAEPEPVAGEPARVQTAVSVSAQEGTGEAADALFAEANQARRSGDLTRAVGLYRKLQSKYPRSKEAELSQVTLSMLLLDRGDAAAALAGFDAYLSRSRRPLEAEALVGRARAYRSLGSRDAEVKAWREVQRRYPGSIYSKQAAERLAALGQ